MSEYVRRILGPEAINFSYHGRYFWYSVSDAYVLFASAFLG